MNVYILHIYIRIYCIFTVIGGQMVRVAGSGTLLGPTLRLQAPNNPVQVVKIQFHIYFMFL